MSRDPIAGDKILNLLRVRLRAGAVVPFVGAGVSRAVEKPGRVRAFPSWNELLDEMARELDRTKLKKDAALMRAHLLDPPDYLAAAQVARRSIPETRWKCLLTELVDIPKAAISNDSLALARAVWLLNHFVVTTNYDRVLSWAGEEALHVEPKVVNIQDSKHALIDAINRTTHEPTVWHIHGHIQDPAQLVLAPDSYNNIYTPSDEGQSRFEAARSVLRMILAVRSLLFIGFSLDDLFFTEQLDAIARVFDGKGGPHFVLLKRNDIEQKRSRLEALGVLPVAYEDHGRPLVELVEQLARWGRPPEVSPEIKQGTGFSAGNPQRSGRPV